MLSLCETMLDFYPKEVMKIHERIGRFEEVKEYWKRKQDLWA